MFDASRFESDVIASPYLTYFFGLSGVDVGTIGDATAAKVHATFEQITQGKFTNPTEQWPVTHHMCRNEHKSDTLNQIVSCANLIKSRNITTICHIGIGGSVSGTKWVSHALSTWGFGGNHPPIVYISNHDEDHINAALKGIDIEKTMFIVVSKSGKTVEIHAILDVISSKQSNPNFYSDQCIAITTKNSPLDRPDVMKTIPFDTGIGGRFSTTSVASLLTIGLGFGYDVADAFLTGAHLADMAAKNHWKTNIALTQATVRYHQQLAYPGLAFVAYGHALNNMPGYMKQLICESLGKGALLDGQRSSSNHAPLFMEGVGPNAQHSFFQQLHQGAGIIPVEFTSSAATTPNQEHMLRQIIGQMVALSSGDPQSSPTLACTGNRPSTLLLLHSLTPEAMGYMVATMENRVVFEGLMHHINPFDQPGVELGKRVAEAIDQPGSDAEKAFKQVATFLAQYVE
jgi:glucose-6-phosphate isomerase